MPKHKEPRTLKDLAIETLGMKVFRVSQKAIDAIASGQEPEINKISNLHEYLYADLPFDLSHKVSFHMLAVVRRVITIYESSFDELGSTNVKDIMGSVVLASVYPQITILDMSNLTRYLQRILASNIQAYQKLQTLILSSYVPADVLEILPLGLSLLTGLVNFRMHCMCTDTIINTLGKCCSGSIEQIDVNDSQDVTDASVESLTQCHKLNQLSVGSTSMTAEGFDQFLKSVQEYKKTDDTAKGLLSLSVGSEISGNSNWDISTTQLNEIAITCPLLKTLEITHLSGKMETLANLTELEVLEIKENDVYKCNFDECNLDGFLRLRGSNLRSLRLDADYVDLTCIMNNCFNVKELVFFDGSIKDISLTDIEIDANAFKNLEILELHYEVSPSTIERMLYECVNVKRLRLFTEQEDVTDEFISGLLTHNPLQMLTSFSTFAPKLSMITANALIDQCPLLEELKYLGMWKGVTHAEIQTLRKRIKDNNLNLTIY